VILENIIDNTTMLVGRRLLRDPATIGSPGSLSHVAAPTYSHPEGVKKSSGDPAYVAAQTIETEAGPRQVVIIDSTASQMNRTEERLAEIFDGDPTLTYPRVSIPFPNGPTLTNWLPSHRSADQIWRLTDYFDEPSRRMKGGHAFVKPYADLTWFLEHFPIDVILGVWHAHKGPTLKLPRLLSATMIGYSPIITNGEHPHVNPRRGDGTDPVNRLLSGKQKSDPLITGSAGVKYRKTPGEHFPEEIVDFDFTSKDNALSAAGLGDIPGTVLASNIFALEYVEQRVSLALAPLMNARFPSASGQSTPERDAAGRAVLIALAKIAFAATMQIDGLLRSSCLLATVPSTTHLYAIDRSGADREVEPEDMDELLRSYRSAIAQAQAHGFTFAEVIAKPKPQLISLYENRGKHINRDDAVEMAAEANADDDTGAARKGRTAKKART